MGRFLLGLACGMLLVLLVAETPAQALRIARPPEFHEWNTNTFTQLNDTLLQLWNISNGRITLDVVTVDPDGSRLGSKGELIYFDSGTDQLCVNSTGATAWVCVNLT